MNNHYSEKKNNAFLEYRRRIWMTIIGVLITGFSVGMFNFSTFGMDPFQVFAHGVSYHLPFGFGTFYTLLNLVMLIFIYIIDRTKIGLGTLINIFLLGYMVQFSSWFFTKNIQFPTVFNRSILLIIGLTLLCLGSAIYFTADMGVSTYDAISLIMTEKKIAKFHFCRMGTDIFCTLVGFLLGATVGIGTVMTAFFMGPIIQIFSTKVAVPLRYGREISIEKK